MNYLKSLLLFILIGFGLSACAPINTTKLTYSNITNTTATPFAQNKAQVHFLRPNMLGWPNHAAIYDDSAFIGFVPHNGQLTYQADPGEHLFMVTGESADFMKADLIEGRTYYVQVQPRMGVWGARFSLIPVVKDDITSAQVQEWLTNAARVENNDAAYKWAEKNKKDEMEKKKKYYKTWMEKSNEDRPYLQSTDGI